jgi:hypothetical protein
MDLQKQLWRVLSLKDGVENGCHTGIQHGHVSADFFFQNKRKPLKNREKRDLFKYILNSKVQSFKAMNQMSQQIHQWQLKCSYLFSQTMLIHSLKQLKNHIYTVIFLH